MRKLHLYLFACSLTALASCEDQLDQVPISDASAANFYRNTDDFRQAVNGAYNSLRTYPDRLYHLSEIRSDNIYGVGEAGVRDHEPINNFHVTLATNPLVEAAWDENYAGILRANTVLDRLAANPGAVADATLRTRFEAEARFLRAFYYFDLVRLFGRVPLIDRIMTSTEVLEVPRAPVEEVYSLIMSDFQFAIQNLPATYSGPDLGRATANAARGMLARVYLTRSGPTYDIEGPGLGKNEYAQALTLLNEIIASGERFVAEYPRIFSYTNENNPEVLFDIQFQGGGLGLGGTFPGAMGPQPYFAAAKIPFPVSLEIQPVSTDLIQSYPAGDIRRAFNFQEGFTDVQGVRETRPFIRKWLDETRYGVDRFDWPINFIVLRYTDVLLMKAEAILQGGGGSQAEVDAAVNRVRARAGLGMVSGVTLRMLMEERRREFAGEGLRWHDLVRSGLVLDVMNEWLKEEDIRNQMPESINANHIIYPVPSRQLTVKAGLYNQNPGYN